MEWFVLIFVTFLYVASSYIAYQESWRQSSWYLPTGMLIGVLLTILWVATVKYIDNRERIYFFSLAWDFIMVAVFYLLPLFMGVKLDKWGLFGLTLVAAGLVLVKIRLASFSE